MFKKYYINLINRIYYILILFESESPEYISYVESLIFELSGNDDFSECHSIKYKLNALLKQEGQHKLVKKTVFDSINIIDKILSNWKE